MHEPVMQSTDPSSITPQPETDEILADLLTALDFLTQTRGREVAALRVEAVQARVASIQRRAMRKVAR